MAGIGMAMRVGGWVTTGATAKGKGTGTGTGTGVDAGTGTRFGALCANCKLGAGVAGFVALPAKYNQAPPAAISMPVRPAITRPDRRWPARASEDTCDSACFLMACGSATDVGADVLP